MLLTAYNYKLLIYGVIAVIAGFGGMYIEGQQFGIYSLYIAPILVLGGFVVVAMAVFRTDPELLKREEAERKESSEPTSSTS